MCVGSFPVRSVLVLLFAAGCGAPSEAPGPAAATPVIEEAPVPPVDPVVPPAVPEPAIAPTDAAAPEEALPAAPVTAPIAKGSAPPAQPATPASQTAPAKATPSAPAAAPVTPSTTPVTPASTPVTPPAPAAAPAAADYTLDPGKGSLYVQVFKEGSTIASGLSHDHVMSATGWNGTVHWDPADPSACKVDIRVPVSGLRVDDEATRKRVGYDVMLDADQREEVKSNMLAAGQLDARRFSDITFTATGCEAAGDRVKVTGKLSVHGVAKSVASTMKITSDGSTFSAAGTFTAKATDFGFQPYSALLGALKNQNEMKFTVDVRGASK